MNSRTNINAIDKTSGLIISERTDLSFTLEEKDGSIKNPMASVIIKELENATSKKYSKKQGSLQYYNLEVPATLKRY